MIKAQIELEKVKGFNRAEELRLQNQFEQEKRKRMDHSSRKRTRDLIESANDED